MMRVLIAGGGTGGHVMPALAIGRELSERYGAEVRFVGTARGLETRLVPEAGFALELIEVGQLKGVSLRTRLRTMGDLPRGVRRCLGLLREFRPAVVIGVGGYASGPAMAAAIAARVPTLAFEPNAVPGLANRVIGRVVSTAAVNFEETRRYFRRATVTGVPVRTEFFALPGEREAVATPQLLVFGGSQGARALNERMAAILPALLDGVPGLTVLHQAGARHAEATRAAFAGTGADPGRWRVEGFLEAMPARFAEASLVMCRSGASSLAELAAAGRPSLLVPFPQAADDHQRRNAELFARAGAAELVLQRELTEGVLLERLVGLMGAPERLREMAGAARALARPQAAERIGRMVMELARG